MRLLGWVGVYAGGSLLVVFRACFVIAFEHYALTKLLDLLAENAQIGAYLDRAALARLCDPANYLGQSGVMVDRVLATLR
jgi:adenylosuccinate lyase